MVSSYSEHDYLYIAFLYIFSCGCGYGCRHYPFWKLAPWVGFSRWSLSVKHGCFFELCNICEFTTLPASEWISGHCCQPGSLCILHPTHLIFGVISVSIWGSFHNPGLSVSLFSLTSSSLSLSFFHRELISWQMRMMVWETYFYIVLDFKTSPYYIKNLKNKIIFFKKNIILFKIK